jgi:hypothetical protein
VDLGSLLIRKENWTCLLPFFTTLLSFHLRVTNHARAAFPEMASSVRIASLPSFIGRGAALLAIVAYAIIAYAASSSSSSRSAQTPDRQSAATAAATAAHLSDSTPVGFSHT